MIRLRELHGVKPSAGGGDPGWKNVPAGVVPFEQNIVSQAGSSNGLLRSSRYTRYLCCWCTTQELLA